MKNVYEKVTIGQEHAVTCMRLQL